MLITVIQDGKNSPKEYFSLKHSEESKITTETAEAAFNILEIDKIIIIQDFKI